MIEGRLSGCDSSATYGCPLESMMSKPVKVTHRDLWQFLSVDGHDMSFDQFVEAYADEKVMSQETFNAIKAADLEEIVVDQDMAESCIGGDDVVGIVDDVIGAIKDGYTVVTWYGDSAEAMVIGYKLEQLRIVS